MDIDAHLAGFADAFVVAAKRDRWRELLTRRRRNVFEDSHKLMDALDPRFCRRDNGPWKFDPDQQCVFYDFFGEPKVVPFRQALAEGTGRDALASLEAGLLAIHWSHEDWAFVCRKPPGR